MQGGGQMGQVCSGAWEGWFSLADVVSVTVGILRNVVGVNFQENKGQTLTFVETGE